MPDVTKNRSFSLFQLISLTSNLKCCSCRIFFALKSMKVRTSSLFPTATVRPSGDQQMLMFSPLVLIVETHRLLLTSQKRTVLSRLAVTKYSGCFGCQQI